MIETQEYKNKTDEEKIEALRKELIIDYHGLLFENSSNVRIRGTMLETEYISRKKKYNINK